MTTPNPEPTRPPYSITLTSGHVAVDNDSRTEYQAVLYDTSGPLAYGANVNQVLRALSLLNQDIVDELVEDVLNPNSGIASFEIHIKPGA